MFLQKIWQEYKPLEKWFSFAFLVLLLLLLLQWAVSAFWTNVVKESGTYAEGLVGELTYINPLYGDFNSVDRDLSRLIFSGLVKYNPAKQLFEPYLANFDISEDAKKYTITLKKDLLWHDGKPVTADDVIFTFDTVVKSPDFPNAILQNVFADVAIQKIDETTVVFNLAQPNAFFLSNLIVGLLPKHIFEQTPVAAIGSELNPALFVGSGPYKLMDLEEDKDGIWQINLLANNDYIFGKPKIRNIRLYVFPSEELLLKNQSDLDAIPLISAQNAAQLDKQKFKQTSYQLPQYTALFLNQENPFLNTERMRKIIKNAFDKNYLATELSNRQAIAGPYFFLEEIDKIPDRDLEPLKKQLTENGWITNRNTSIRENSEGQQLRFVLLARKYEPGSEKEAETKFVIQHIVEACAELGIKIEVTEDDREAFAAKLANKNYDIVLYGQDFVYSLDGYSFWHSSQIGPNTFNLANFQSVSADATLEDLRKTRDQSEQRELLQKLNLILKADAPAIFLYTQKYLFMFDNSVKNRTILGEYATIADRFYDVYDWKL